MRGHDVQVHADEDSMSGALRAVLEEACAQESCSMKALTVLATANDPFRTDTPARHRDGEWLAIQAANVGLGDRRIHLRGLHYMLVSTEVTKPNGKPYRNIDEDWLWLQEHAAKAARWLGYIPFGQITDERNAPPVIRELIPPPKPSTYVHVGIYVDIPDAADLELKPYLFDFHGTQPYKLVLVGEKASLGAVLGPVASMYGADLYLPTGEISDTLIHQMAVRGEADGRPMRVLYFADADPSGWQMAISVARKLQAFAALGIGPEDVQLHRVALTPEQVRQFDLPSTPLKETERRADRWRAATGTEQTESDALATLRPELLREIATRACKHFYDTTLSRRVSAAEAEWRHAATAVVAELEGDSLDAVRQQAAEKLDELREEVDHLNEQMHFAADQVDLPPVPELPQPMLNGNTFGTPLAGLKDRLRRAVPPADGVQGVQTIQGRREAW